MHTVQTEYRRQQTPVIQWHLMWWKAKKKWNVCKENYIMIRHDVIQKSLNGQIMLQKRPAVVEVHLPVLHLNTNKYFTWILTIYARLYSYFTTSQRLILYFLFHYIGLTAFVNTYFSDLNCLSTNLWLEIWTFLINWKIQCYFMGWKLLLTIKKTPLDQL